MEQKKQTKIISFLKRETRKKAKKELPKSNYYCDFFCIPCSRWLCAKRPKIWQKNVNEIVITLKNKTSTENLSARTRPSLLCPLAVAKGCGRCDTKKINLLNTSASARSSLRAKKRVRAACVYPAKFSRKHCDCDISQFAKQVWSPPTYCTTQYPPENHTLCLQLPSC